MQPCSLTDIVYGCFHATMAELKSWVAENLWPAKPKVNLVSGLWFDDVWILTYQFLNSLLILSQKTKSSQHRRKQSRKKVWSGVKGLPDGSVTQNRISKYIHKKHIRMKQIKGLISLWTDSLIIFLTLLWFNFQVKSLKLYGSHFM